MRAATGGGALGGAAAAGMLWVKARLLDLPMAPVLVVVVVVFSTTVPGFATTANFENMSRVFAPLLIAAVGATFIILMAGIDLSVGAVMSLAAVVGATVMRDTQSIVLGLSAGIMVGVLIGCINGAAMAWLRLSPFVYTLGVLLTARAIAFLFSRGHSVGGLPEAAMDYGRASVFGTPVLFLFSLLVFAVALGVLHRTRLGRAFYLIGSNERAARFAGIDVGRAKFAGYFIGSVLGATAGMVAVLRLGSGAPVLGDNILLQVIAAVVVGGTSIYGGQGGLWRTLTGVTLITVLDKGLNLIGIPFYDQAIVIGVVIILGSGLGTWLLNRQLNQSRRVSSGEVANQAPIKTSREGAHRPQQSLTRS